MSAIARYFNTIGTEVFGYDKTKTSLTDKLTVEGISITFNDSITSIPKVICDNKHQTIVVVTPAIPTSHPQLNYFKNNKYEIVKRAKMLGDITKQSTNLSIAGTHGKTTTSCMLATILLHSNLDFSAFLGGISADLESNYYNRGNGKNISITEADEYDRSFLNLDPDYAVITSTDADHLDIYGKENEVVASFYQFSKLVKKELFVSESADARIKGTTYGSSKGTSLYAKNITLLEGKSTFDVEYNDVIIDNVTLNISGVHNILNATAAIGMALSIGIETKIIKKALKRFKGIKRRFEYIYNKKDKVYIDDYAHHPSELTSTISTVKSIYPTKKITGVFQPHLYSRTRDFQDGFAKSLSLLDKLILLDIYPARELPIEGVTSKIIFDKVEVEHKELVKKTDFIKSFNPKDHEILLTLGAGDIDTLVPKIKKCFEKM